MGRGRILAVDDQRYFRELIEGLLVEEGYDVQTCASGEEALRILDHAVFDVIVTDLVMPGMNGCDLVQRVKERDAEQEIMVVTGVVDVKSAVDAMKVGATDYLLKPFDRPTLAKALEGILQRSRLRQERDRLLAENIEYLGERSLFQRALGLFSATSLEGLSA
jgi:DNA-binding NtrC family response regulator